MVGACRRILLLCLAQLISLWTGSIAGYAQGCKSEVVTAGFPPRCIAENSNGSCSPVTAGTGNTGTCRVINGTCGCVGAGANAPLGLPQAIATPQPKASPQAGAIAQPKANPQLIGTPQGVVIPKAVATPQLNVVPKVVGITPATIVPAGSGLRGFVDLHTHPMANLGFGGKLLYGGVDVGSLLPADPDCHANVRAATEQQALGHDKSTHGGHDFFSNSCGDELRKAVIHALQSGLGGADESEDAIGYPDFSEWPVWNDLTHQKMWVEWIRRAYQGGLRVMVALAVNNKTLGDMTAGPGDFATDDKSSADRQINELRSFVGRHGDFMEVALSSADVHRIVSANKLAVVIGIEVDHIGNFETSQNPGIPSDAVVKAEIDRLYGEGVRYIFPIHVLDNAFGGSAAYVNLFNVSTLRESGHPYALICASQTDDINYVYNNNDITLESVAAQLLKLGVATISINYPSCPSGQKNSLALTSTGINAIKEMMRLGMLIDIDHMSQAATDQVLGLAKSFEYPVNSGHNGPRGSSAGSHNERSMRADQYATIGKLHGMAGVGSGGTDSQTWLTSYQKVIQEMGTGVVAGFGTDTDGFALGMPPRPGTHPASVGPGPQAQQYNQCLKDCDCSPGENGKPNAACVNNCARSCRQQFPHTTVQIPAVGVAYTSTFPQSIDGNRTWDLKTDGVAHYGMLWDFIEDVRLLPGGAAVVDNNLMNGADYFFHTWQMAETQASKVH